MAIDYHAEYEFAKSRGEWLWHELDYQLRRFVRGPSDRTRKTLTTMLDDYERAVANKSVIPPRLSTR